MIKKRDDMTNLPVNEDTINVPSLMKEYLPLIDKQVEIGRRGFLQAALIAVASCSATKDELVENALEVARKLDEKLKEWE